MLLTKEQQKFITKILQGIASDIKTEQNKEKKNDDSLLEKGMRLGRQAAYEKCYHIAKTAAEESYEAEYDGADKRLLDIATKLEAQSEVFHKLANNANFEEKDLILDQAALLKNFARDIRIILKQTER